MQTFHVPNLEEARELQTKMAAEVQQIPFDWRSSTLIAGLDVSSTKESNLLTAGIVVWNRRTGEIVDTSFVQEETSFPYIPGFLSFREAPALLKAIEKLDTEPDVFMVDGQGRAHPRRIGIAAHIGVLIHRPTLGVAKSILVGTGEEPSPEKGSVSDLIHKNEVIGKMVRTRDGVKPVYPSVGNLMTLDDCVALTLDCARGYRLPEPTRLAHNHVNAVRETGKGVPIIANTQPSLL
jgi:deoxyribonuclease V